MRSIEGGLEARAQYGPRKITIIRTIIASIGLLLVLYVQDIWQFVFIWGFVVSLGFNLGLYDTVNAAVAKWFIKKARATITGYTTFFSALTNIAYPIFAGWSYDVTGTYVGAFTLIAGAQALAILFMFFAKNPHPHTHNECFIL
jgi:nitrate/nitrite transporter NarK